MKRRKRKVRRPEPVRVIQVMRVQDWEDHVERVIEAAVDRAVRNVTAGAINATETLQRHCRDIERLAGNVAMSAVLITGVGDKTPKRPRPRKGSHRD